MKNKIQIFNTLLDAYNNEPEKIVQLVADNFLIFNEPEELELLIRNDVSRYSMMNNLILPTEVFAIPDPSKEFDPVISNHEVALVYKISKDFNITVQLKLQFNRMDKFIFVDRLITGKIEVTNEWQTIKDDYKSFAVTFNQIKMLRDYKMKGEIV